MGNNDEFYEFMEDAEYALTLTYGKAGEPDDRGTDWDPYYRRKDTFLKAEFAWEEYRRHAEMVGHSSLVCASLRRNGELVAMKAVKVA